MKRLYTILVVGLILTSCKKTDFIQQDQVQKILHDSLYMADFSSLDFGHLTKSKIPGSNNELVTVPFLAKKPEHDFIVMKVDENGSLKGATILHIDGTVSLPQFSKKPTFNGRITASSLTRKVILSFEIIDGFIHSLHPPALGVGSAKLLVKCADCTLEDVVVTTTIHNDNYDYRWLLSLWWLFNDFPANNYLFIDNGSGGGNGGGGGSGTIVTIDTESPESKTKIDPKKYTDCFSAIPNNGSTCTITISSDLPLDDHPETFFNWTDRSPGHAFVQLYKSTPYGSVQQNFGFYPATSFKVLAGTNTASQIVDDGTHEFQASYTIAITPEQLQAAIDKINALNGRDYNISNYNCTDFALDVFNAAGGNLSIPKYMIPDFSVPGGSNTPQGLYQRISQMKAAGNSNASAGSSKQYANSSKGPCN